MKKDNYFKTGGVEGQDVCEELKRRHAALLEASPDAVTVTDLEGKILDVSDKTLALHGYSDANELIGKPAFILIDRGDHRRALENLKKAFEIGFVGNIEYLLLRKDGTTFSGELNAVLIRGGDAAPSAFIATTRDITARKRDEDDADRTSSRLQTVLDGIEEAIVVIGRDYRIVSHNRAFITGLRNIPETVVGSKCFEVIHGYKKSCRKCVVREMFRTRNPTHNIHYHNVKEGRIYHEVKAYPLRVEDEGLKQCIYVFRDVTARETMYEKIKDANQRLEELNRLKSYFISIASHELGTPLAIVKGYVDVISSGILGPVTKNQAEKLTAISTNISHLGRLIDGIFDLSRIESGEFQLFLTKTNVSSLVGSVVEDFRSIAGKKKLMLYYRKPRNPVSARIDSDRIRQVLINILDNSVKFTKPGGSIYMSLRSSEQSVFITVSDSGIGIPKAKLGKIFNSFYQVDSSLRRKYTGVGLGLAICKSIVELHGGDIIVESKINKGTKVIVKLPL